MAFSRLRLLIVLALISGSGSLWAASKEQSAYAAAVAAFQSEMWSRAETEFAQFVQKYPKSTNTPMALLLEAQAEFKQGDFTNVTAKLANPDNLAKAAGLADQYFYWTGEAQFANSNYTAAADTLISLSKNFPDSPLRLRAVVEAAAACARLGDWRRHDALLEGANGVFQQTARLDPGNTLVLDGQLSLENSKYQQRDWTGVAAVYRQLTNHWQLLGPEQQCRSLHLLYQSKMELGDFAAAAATATNLVHAASSPANRYWLAMGWSSQGAALEKMDRLKDAIQAWSNNLTNAPLAQQREAILKIAELQIVRGRLTDAGEQLTNFLTRFPEAVSGDIARLTAGELHLKNYVAQPSATNELAAAQDYFGQLTNGPLAGKAHLNLGWCAWLAGDMDGSLADFTAAAGQLPPSEDQAVARFKMGDALFAQTNYAGALENYRAVLEDFTNFPAVARTLGERAIYQSLRACLALHDLPGASHAVARILSEYPAGSLAPESELLYGEGLAAVTNETAARAVFQQFLSQFPDSPLRPEVEFAIARTYELEQNWPAAITGYTNWLEHFPTNQSKPQVVYALARANSLAGNETQAFGLFTNFVAQFTNSDLAPQAQWWIADHYFRSGTNYADAEKNYELIFQTWPASDLAYRARIMAGRSAMSRFNYAAAIGYFSDTNYPADLRAEAIFADGAALMRMDSTDTNNPLANFQRATDVFSQIFLLSPTNPAAVMLASCTIGDCDIQLGNFDAATNAYAQVFTSTNPAVGAALRSRAQIGFGLALEKKAALASGDDQKALLEQALDNYLDVFDTWTGKNLRDGETADPRWVKKAGLQALELIKTLGTANPDKFIDQMESLFPESKDSLEKIRAGLSSQKN